MACCRVVEQGRTPSEMGAKQPASIQLAAPELRVCTILSLPEPGQRRFVIRDECSALHRVPPLLASCVWLI
jgi:hypothetical protein